MTACSERNHQGVVAFGLLCRGAARRWALGSMFVLFVPLASHASTLSDAAAALQPGHYVAISTGLTGDVDLNPDPNAPNSMLDYSDSGAWDPVRHKFSFIGKEAGCGSPLRNIVYDEASNSWSYGSLPPFNGCGHGYDQNASDPVTGTHYFRPYDSQVYKETGSGWTQLASLPQPNSIVGGLAKSPYGLLYSDFVWDAYYDDATGQQSTVDFDNTYPGWPNLGGYHSIAEYDPVHNVFLIGGGNDSQIMYKVTIVSGRPVRTRLNDAPFTIGVGEGDQHTNVTADPVTGEFIIYRRSTGTFYGYNIMTDTWRTLGTSGDGRMPPIPSTSGGTSAVAAPINSYGVIMYIGQNGSQASVYLYKHATAGPPDLTPPNRPAQLIAR